MIFGVQVGMREPAPLNTDSEYCICNTLVLAVVEKRGLFPVLVRLCELHGVVLEENRFHCILDML